MQIQFSKAEGLTILDLIINSGKTYSITENIKESIETYKKGFFSQNRNDNPHLYLKYMDYYRDNLDVTLTINKEKVYITDDIAISLFDIRINDTFFVEDEEKYKYNNKYFDFTTLGLLILIDLIDNDLFNYLVREYDYMFESYFCIENHEYNEDYYLLRTIVELIRNKTYLKYIK